MMKNTKTIKKLNFKISKFADLPEDLREAAGLPELRIRPRQGKGVPDDCQVEGTGGGGGRQGEILKIHWIINVFSLFFFNINRS